MSRKTLQDDEKNAVCVRYAQTGSLRAVASEYGISPMRVKRLWEALGEQQQQVLRASVEDLRQEVETTIVRSELTGDYLERVIKARDAAIAELWARLSDAKLRRAMSDKNLIAACKTLYDMKRGRKATVRTERLVHGIEPAYSQRNQSQLLHTRAWNDRGRRFR